jgi:hypothetical protein
MKRHHYTAPEKPYLLVEKYTDYGRLLDRRVEWIMKYNNLFESPQGLQQQYMIQHIVEVDGMWLGVITDSKTKEILNVSQDYRL